MKGRVSRTNSKEDAPFVVERTGDYLEAKTLPKLAKCVHVQGDPRGQRLDFVEFDSVTLMFV